MNIFSLLTETQKAPTNVARRSKVTARTLDFAAMFAEKASPRSMRDAGDAALRITADAAGHVRGKVRRGEDGGVRTAPGQIELSFQDVLALRNQLEKTGISPTRLERLTRMASTPGACSLGRIIATLRMDGPNANLDPDAAATPVLLDNQRLDAKQFLQKIGMQPDEADGILAQMDAGNTGTAWTAVSGKLAGKSDAESIDVNVSELEALSKGLKLSPEVLAAMKALFGAQTEISTTPTGLKAVLVPAGQEMAAREQADRNLATALGAALEPVLQAARKSADRSALSDRRSDRTTQRTEVLIRESATSKGNGSETAPALDAERHENDSNRAEKSRQSGLLRTAGSTREHAGTAVDATQQNVAASSGNRTGGHHTGQWAQMAPGDATAQAAGLDRHASQPGNGDGPIWRHDRNGMPGNVPGAVPDMGAGTDAGTGPDTRAGADTGARAGTGPGGDLWAELLRRIDVSPSMHTAVQSIAPDMAASAAGAAQRQNPAPAPYLSPQAAAQLERGILTSMQDGTRQLTMKLDPGELGNVTVTLSVRNGEVNATIRPDRTETVQAINDQLHVLRNALEQQGLKVDRLEVQTQLQDNSFSQAWQDAAQHNAGQDQHARGAERERHRRLRRMRDGNEGTGPQAAEMAAAASNSPTLSASGLDIIA